MTWTTSLDSSSPQASLSSYSANLHPCERDLGGPAGREILWRVESREGTFLRRLPRQRLQHTREKLLASPPICTHRSENRPRDAAYTKGRFDTRSWFQPCLADAKITGYVWHLNRHTFCSWLAMAGHRLRRFRRQPGTRRSPCRPATATCHRNTSFRWSNASPGLASHVQALIDTTRTKTGARQKMASLPREAIFPIHPLFCWCREGGSNPHDRKGRRILSPLRLPVPPSRHIC